MVKRTEYFDPESNIIIREMWFEHAGDEVPGHEHEFPHTLYIARGAAEVTIGARVFHLDASAGLSWVLVRAGELHHVRAKVAGTIGHCVFAHRTPQGEVSLTYTGRGAD